MIETRYSRGSITTDALRAAGGLACTLLPLALISPTSWVAWIFMALAVLFTIYALSILQRSRTRFQFGPEGLVQTSPGRTKLDWPDLRGLKLRYYSTQRNRENGWFQLQLETDSGRIKVDTNLEDFDKILILAHQAARANNLDLDPATRENLIAMGQDVAA